MPHQQLLVLLSLQCQNQAQHETNRPKRSQGIFCKTFAGIPHCFNQALRNICGLRRNDQQFSFSGSYAIAFIVKSLRFRSSSIFLLNVTESGRRLSEYVDSVRYGGYLNDLREESVAASFTTPTVPKLFS